MNIPPDAQQVFKGIIFSVYQWQQRLFDGSYATYEAMKRPGTVQVIPVIDGKIVLSYEEQPSKPLAYTFLGGRQEPGEEPLESAKRELKEETGFISDDWELYKTYEFKGHVDWPTYLFIARNCQKVSETQLEPGERIELKYFDFDQFIEKVLAEDFWTDAKIINHLLRLKLADQLSELKERLQWK